MYKYFAMCGIFNAKQNYIYSEGMQWEDVVSSPLPSPLLLPLPPLLLPSSDVWKSSAPDKFYAKIKCKNERNAHNSYKHQIQVVKYRLQILFPWWIQNNWKEKFTRDCSLPNDLAWIFVFVLSQTKRLKYQHIHKHTYTHTHKKCKRIYEKIYWKMLRTYLSSVNIG